MFVSQVEQCVQQETKVGDLAATMELRVVSLRVTPPPLIHCLV